MILRIASYLKLNVASILFVCWYALCLFSTSDAFSNIDNDIKTFISIFGGIIVISFALMLKNPRSACKQLCSSHTLNLLFLIGTILAFQGLLQYLGMLPSHHPMFHITGSFENPAGITAVLALLLPIGISWWIECSKNARIYIGILLLEYISVILLAGERTAIISVVISSFVVLSMKTDLTKRIFHSRIMTTSAIVVFFGVSFAMYHLKAESVIGRLLIWKISLPLIAHKPLFGHGINGFKTKYMTEQADYFQINYDDINAMLADNISHPFNEFINIGINYGIVGVAAFIFLLTMPVYLALRNRKEHSSIIVACIVSFTVLAMFSYPLQYAPVWILMIMLFILSINHYLPVRLSFMYRIIIALIIIFRSYLLFHTVIAELNWKRISDRSLEGQTQRMIPFFNKLHENTILKHNGYFLYNYAAELNYSDKYNESIKILNECKSKIFDYDVVLLYTDNFQNLHQQDSVIKYATLASNMVPCRFLPYSYLFQAYLNKNDTANAVKTANLILEKEVKIPSLTVDEIKREASEFLNHIKTTSSLNTIYDLNGQRRIVASQLQWNPITPSNKFLL